MLPPGVIPGPASTGMAAEDIIARQVVHDVLPSLEELLFVLARLQKIWNVPQNAIPEKIVTAAKAGQPLGGYAPADWARWGQTLLALDMFLQTPIELQLPDGSTEKVTPESVLLTKYTPMEVTQQ